MTAALRLVARRERVISKADACAISDLPHGLLHLVLLLLDVDLHVEVLHPDGNAASLELRVLHSQLLELLRNDLVRLLKDLDEHTGLACIVLEKQGVSDSFLVPSPASAANTMNVVLFVFRAVEIDNSFDRWDVEASTCHVGGNQDV